jgi:hypothetical protein
MTLPASSPLGYLLALLIGLVVVAAVPWRYPSGFCEAAVL